MLKTRQKPLSVLRYLLHYEEHDPPTYMLKTRKWSIFTRDGHYLGQYSAFAPETALSQYLAVSGRDVSERQIRYDHVDENVHTLSLDSEIFVVTGDESLRKAWKMH
jgi:hypothetical protein